MDSEFPDPNEEFELNHADEFDLLRELEDLTESVPENTPSTKPPVVQRKPKVPVLSDEKTKETDESPRNSLIVQQNAAFKELDSFPQTINTIVDSGSAFHTSYTNCDTSKSLSSQCNGRVRSQKRTVDELLEDVDNILKGQYSEDSFLEPEVIENKKKRPRWSEFEEVKKLLLEERKKYICKDSDVSFENQDIKRINSRKDSITTRVPRWNFVAITRHEDGQRLYIRVSEDNKQTVAKIRPASRLLSVSYSQLKAEAEDIILRNKERMNHQQAVESDARTIDDRLWVDKYKPKKYMELLSDESVNKNFLRWLKLWDKVVFNREPKRNINRKFTETLNKSRFKNAYNKETEVEFDDKGYPFYKIALLSGPPGLGKTTLAHVAARHAGYNVIEINASDDREPNAFREVLLSSTQMKAVIGADPRPNCLVLDEIDGAPAASIVILKNFVQGTLLQKGKKNKERMEKLKQGCQRPIVCICNDLYTPALRQLKTIAKVFTLSPIKPAILADRLMEIARRENLTVELRDMIKLVERSGCDVRTCLGALQYMGNANLKDNLSLGLKDIRKGLFDSWKTLLQVPMTQYRILSPLERVKLVLITVQQGESDRLAQGVFHNYPTICRDKMSRVARSLQWFQFFDEISRIISSRQVWTIAPYMNYAFVVWHFDLATSSHNFQLSYPSAFFEMNQKLSKNNAILTVSQKTSGVDRQTLALDIAPLLPEILNPRLRSVSAHLYSSKEKTELMHLINVMLDYGLTLIQEKKPEGGFEYCLEPDLFEIGIFPGCKIRRGLSYAVKQIVIQELEVERVKRAAAAFTTGQRSSKNQKKGEKTKDSREEETKVKVPNHLKQELEPISVKPINSRKFQDFFCKFKEAGQAKIDQRGDSELLAESSSKAHVTERPLFKKDFWYKFKEGYTNAVRRNIKMEDLL